MQFVFGIYLNHVFLFLKFLIKKMINHLIIKLIIYFGCKNLPEFVRLLAKLEYGVSACLTNLALQAEKDNYHGLAAQLSKHAAEEKSHGKMLGSLIDGKRRIELRGGGRWLSLTDGKGNEIANHPEAGNGKLITSGKYSGIFDNLDGISQRYKSLQLLLWGKKINDLPWESRLACMACLEEATLRFYIILASTSNLDFEIRAIALKIAGEEGCHANYFKYVLPQFSYFPEKELNKWRLRIFWARFALIIDFILWTKKYLMSGKN